MVAAMSAQRPVVKLWDFGFVEFIFAILAFHMCTFNAQFLRVYLICIRCIFPVATLATLLHPYGVFVVDVAEDLAPSATSTNS